MSAIAAATPAAFVEEPSRDGTPVVIRVSGLRKSYGSVEAVAGIDFDVRAGEIFAFVGPNGAGKTTTVEMLEGYRHRSGGEVEVLGVDPQAPTRAWRSRIGVVLQSCQLPPLLSVRELVSRFATYYPTPRGVVVMPVVELFILVSSFGNETIRVPGQPSTFKESTYLVATIVSVGIISATFFNVTTSLAQERESGVLKRLRSAPLPTRVFIAARVGNAILASVVLTVLLIILGRLLYGVPVPGTRMLALVLALAIGAFAFCCLAFLFTLAAQNAGALASMAMGTMLLLFFISGNFFNVTNHTMVAIAKLFPVRHLNQAMLIAFNPHTAGSGVAWSHLAVIAAWGLGALLLSARYFRWAPSSQ